MGSACAWGVGKLAYHGFSALDCVMEDILWVVGDCRLKSKKVGMKLEVMSPEHGVLGGVSGNVQRIGVECSRSNAYHDRMSIPTLVTDP